MNQQHTSGQWWFAQHDEFGRFDIGQGDSAIARTLAPTDSGPGEAPLTSYRFEEQRANARLMHAAPDLLAALLECRRLLVEGTCESWHVEATRDAAAAILKATGAPSL